MPVKKGHQGCGRLDGDLPRRHGRRAVLERHWGAPRRKRALENAAIDHRGSSLKTFSQA
jgi:hypothetical protein